MSRVRIVVPARNEAGRLGQCLAALLESVEYARGIVGHGASECRDIDIVVVVDRCSDGTAAIARHFSVSVLDCPPPFGKVEALRAGFADVADIDGAVVVGVDADVVVGRRTIGDLLTTIEAGHGVLVACPPLRPLPPRHRTPLAWALYRYNVQRGFSSERRWFNGRCWASRHVAFPTTPAMSKRADDVGLAPDHPLRGPLLAEDIWLSRHITDRGGEAAIAVIDTDPVDFRPPATIAGMTNYWRRLRRELWRIDVLFPELRSPPARRPDLLATAPASDRVAWWMFQAALTWCRWRARNDAALVDEWHVVAESKAP